jgi:hypothetical protein
MMWSSLSPGCSVRPQFKEHRPSRRCGILRVVSLHHIGACMKKRK